MRKNCLHISSLALVILLVLFQGVTASDYGETYFRFKTPDRSTLDKVTRLISVDRVDPTFVFAYASNRELPRFEQLGIEYEVLPHPGTLIDPVMSANKGQVTAWDVYPTYDDYVATMYAFETNYPDLCTIVDAGTSVNGRAILFARISDNVDIAEDEPEVMLTSTMHGDETTGWILSLRLIDSLLAGYGIAADVTRLVDSLDIWINPLANPDGTYYSGNHTVSGARRYNANGVDLNRNFPDPDPNDGDHPDGNPWQTETVVFMDFADGHSMALSANLHGGVEVINYPWDTYSRLHPDNDWYYDISLAWAISAQANSPAGYMVSAQFPDGTTNGYAWYHVAGGRQDYMNSWHGCREVTPELSDVKLLPAAQLPAHWGYNKAALLAYLENALYGVRGLVTDASTSQPLSATIQVLGHDVDNSEVYTDPGVGNYHRMLSAGTYNLEFSAFGYYPDTAYAVTVTDNLSTRLDVALTALSGTPLLILGGNKPDLIRAGIPSNITISLINNGDGNALDLTGLLIGNDPYITVTENSAAYPVIAGLGDSQASLTPYQVTIDADCPKNHIASFTLELTGSDGFSQSLPVPILIEPVVEDFESGNLSLFPWETTGPGWGLSFMEAAEGTFSTFSQPTDHGQATSLSVTLEAQTAGILYFDYKVSSEAGFDLLRFEIDGIEQDAWSGEIDWNRAEYRVEPGTRTFTWVYEKDANSTFGSDRAWIDRIIFPQLTSSLAIVTTSVPDWTVGEPYDVQLQQSGSLGQVIWSDISSDLGGTGLSLEAGGLLTGTPVSAGGISFTASVEDATGETLAQPLAFDINPRPAISTASLPDGERFNPYAHQLISTRGTPPLTWTDASGGLEGTGLTLTTDGLISGTPVVRDLLEFTVELQDGAGALASSPLALFIDGGCCQGMVGDVNQSGDDTPTIGDISLLIDFLFISGSPINCYTEADVNQSGGLEPTVDDLTIGDVSLLIDHLFLSNTDPADCL